MTAHPEAQKEQVEIGVKILAEINSPAYILRLHTGEAQLNLYARIIVFDAEDTIPPSELIELLAKNHIGEGVDLEEVARFCSKAAMGINQENVLLARGTEPTVGDDGWLELSVRTSDACADYHEDAKGNVDLRTLNTFTNVEDGQQIGIIHPPQLGISGFTLQGEPIAAIKGQPLVLALGEGVKLSEDGATALSTSGGRVVFDGRALSIAEEFVVRGDVDLSVGNIDFNGVVEISGDVLDDFNITASKGIRISGAVGACRLISGGPVEIGSMAGLGTGLVRCQGDLRAKYLNQVQVECWGNVEVALEIRNCSVKATRAIMVERGTISGGEMVALDGIEAKHLGAVSGIKTRLTAGIYFPEVDRLASLQQQQRSYNQQVQHLNTALAPRNKSKNMRKALQEALELRANLLTQRKATIEQEKTNVDKSLAEFKAEDHPSANPKINALGSLKEGVAIVLGSIVEEIKYEHTGPISVIEDRTKGILHFMGHSPLQVLAKEIGDEELDDSEE